MGECSIAIGLEMKGYMRRRKACTMGSIFTTGVTGTGMSSSGGKVKSMEFKGYKMWMKILLWSGCLSGAKRWRRNLADEGCSI